MTNYKKGDHIVVDKLHTPPKGEHSSTHDRYGCTGIVVDIHFQNAGIIDVKFIDNEIDSIFVKCISPHDILTYKSVVTNSVINNNYEIY